MPDAAELDYALKSAIAQRLWGHDGSMRGEEQVVGEEFVAYLEGLHDAGLTAAQDLIDAINTHGRVVIWIE